MIKIKKSIIILLCVMIAFSMQFGMINASAVFIGDVDGNGKISTTDARLALRHAVSIINLTSAQAKRADANNNGVVQTSDARKILKIAVNIDLQIEDTNCSTLLTSNQQPLSQTYKDKVTESNSTYNTMPAWQRATSLERLMTIHALANAGASLLKAKLPNGATALKHFLGNTGSTFTVPSSLILGCTIQGVVDKRNEVSTKLTNSKASLSGVGFTTTYGLKSSVSYNGESPTFTDWWFTVNGCEFWGKATTKNGSITKKTLYLYDLYDFDPTSNVSIFESVFGALGGMTGAMLYELHYAGLAKQFPSKGEATLP